MSSRSLDDLYPQTRAKVDAWLTDCECQGLHILVTSTYRSFAEQDALYAQGRTKPGKRVTNAKAGTSFHNVRRGIDFVPLAVGGKPNWSATNPDLLKAAEIGEKHGLRWGGRWKSFKDMLHLEDELCDKHGEVGPKATHFNEDGTCKLG